MPPGLNRLSKTLLDFVELFEIDTFLVQTAAKYSGEYTELNRTILKNALAQLSRETCRDFLWRLVLNESNLSAKLYQHLDKCIKQEQEPVDPETAARLPAAELLHQARQAREDEDEKQRVLTEIKRKHELDKLSEQEPRLWEKVAQLIAKKQVKAYDEAVNILKELKELAEYQGRGVNFQEKVNLIHKKYPRLPGLKFRLEQHGMMFCEASQG